VHLYSLARRELRKIFSGGLGNNQKLLMGEVRWRGPFGHKGQLEKTVLSGFRRMAISWRIGSFSSRNVPTRSSPVLCLLAL